MRQRLSLIQFHLHGGQIFVKFSGVKPENPRVVFIGTCSCLADVSPYFKLWFSIFQANCPQLPQGMTGKTFSHVFGTNTSR
jgi:hypothetical protein